MRFLTIDDVDLKGKTVLVRVDYNVPIEKGKIRGVTRIDRTVSTLEELREKGAKIILISHLGQPKGKIDARLSLYPLTRVLSDALWGTEVQFFPGCCLDDDMRETVKNLKNGDILLLENLRFYPGEEANDLVFANDLAQLADYYINDAFSVSHRAHASVDAITKFLPSLGGRLMQSELEAIDKVFHNPKKPLMAIVGGSKVSTKIELLENLIDKVDVLAVAGGMANTFLLAKGYRLGNSLCELNKVDVAKSIMEKAVQKGCELLLPSDFMVTRSIDPLGEVRRVSLDQIQDDDIALDIGSTTVKAFQHRLKRSKTLLWNGPLGMFEISPFDKGTVEVAKFVGALTDEGKLISVAGGGDTMTALYKARCVENFTYVSLAGGAFLQLIEGRPLPGLVALYRSNAEGTTCTTKKYQI